MNELKKETSIGLTLLAVGLCCFRKMRLRCTSWKVFYRQYGRSRVDLVLSLSGAFRDPEIKTDCEPRQPSEGAAGVVQRIYLCALRAEITLCGSCSHPTGVGFSNYLVWLLIVPVLGGIALLFPGAVCWRMAG